MISNEAVRVTAGGEVSGEAEPIRILSARDERELSAYFNQDPVPVPGAQSNYGPQFDRVARGVDPYSLERPTPLTVVHNKAGKIVATFGAPSNEVIACKGHGTVMRDPEALMVRYLDAGRRFRRTAAILATLSDRDRDVLNAYYGEYEDPNEHRLVRLLGRFTSVARRENRARAAADVHEAVDATAQDLTRAALDTRRSKQERDEVRAKARAMKREVVVLLHDAQVAYALARDAARCR
jgi:hypothetical protein